MDISEVVNEIRKILELHDVKFHSEDSVIKAKPDETPFSLVIDLSMIDRNIVNISLEFENDLDEFLEELYDEHDDVDNFKDAVESILEEIRIIDSKLQVVLRKRGIDVDSSVAEDLSDIDDAVEELIEERG